MSRLLIDDRMVGAHGIGRYAKEVISRLSYPWVPIDLRTNPADPLDFLRRRNVPRDSVLYSPGYYAGLWTRRQVVTVHDLIHLWTGQEKYRAYYHLVLRPRIREMGVVFTVSQTSHDAIEDWLGDPDVRIVVTGNGCSPAFTPHGQFDSGGPKYLLFVGNLKEHKNLPTLLRALQRLSAELVVVSNDPSGAQQLAGALGVSERVHVRSGLSDEQLARLYRGASATVVPSVIEGFGLPALESLACGTPVVYWDGCESVKEIVGEYGISVDSAGAPDQWVDALESILSERVLVNSERIRELYSWDRVAAVIDSELAKIIHDV